MKEKTWKCGSLIIIICMILIACYPFLYDHLESSSGLYAQGLSVETVIDASGDGTEAEEKTIELASGYVIRQSFISPCDQIFSIRPYIVTFSRKNLGYVCARLLDASNGEILQSWEMTPAKFRDNDYNAFLCSSLTSAWNMKGHEYIFEIWSEGPGFGNAIGIKQIKEDVYPEGKLFVNDEEQEGDLRIKVIGTGERIDYRLTRLWLRIYAAVGLEILFGATWLKLRAKKEKAV